MFDNNTIFLFRNINGVTALFTVLILSSAVLLISITASFLGIGELDIGYTSHKGSETTAMAESCFEEVLYTITFNEDYGVGEGALIVSFPFGTCLATITDITAGIDERRSILIEGMIDNFTHSIFSEITLSETGIVVDSYDLY